MTAEFPMMNEMEVASLTISRLDEAYEPRLMEILDEFGVAVVTDMVDSEEIRSLEADWGRDLISLINTEEDPDPRIQEAIQALMEAPAKIAPKVWPNGSNIGNPFVIEYGLPHGKFAWSARMLPQMKHMFEIIFKHFSTDGTIPDLVTSFDVIFFSPQKNPSSKRCRYSLHVDQDSNDPQIGNEPEFQAALYLWPSSDQTSTTVVWPKSHREIHPLLMEDEQAKVQGRMGMHYFEINHLRDAALKDRLRKESLVGARRVPVPAGACLVWSSKAVHQGWSHGPRLAVPVCWEPRSRRSSQARNRKLRLCLQRLPTTHWASFGYQHDLALGLTHPSLPSGLRERSTEKTETGVGDADDSSVPIIPNGLMLPFRGGIVTDFILREGLDREIEGLEAQRLCSLSESYEDCDDEVADRIAMLLRPEIVEVL